MDETAVRNNLVELLSGGHAHLSPKDALAGVAPEHRQVRPEPGQHTLWELLEHLRLAQEDILRYTLDPAWQSPPFPGGYWPPPRDTVSDARWNASVAAFLADLDEVIALARDTKRDLSAQLPHGEGRTYLRQVLLVADHNAYHLGQFVLARKLVGDWGREG